MSEGFKPDSRLRAAVGRITGSLRALRAGESTLTSPARSRAVSVPEARTPSQLLNTTQEADSLVTQVSLPLAEKGGVTTEIKAESASPAGDGTREPSSIVAAEAATGEYQNAEEKQFAEEIMAWLEQEAPETFEGFLERHRARHENVWEHENRVGRNGAKLAFLLGMNPGLAKDSDAFHDVGKEFDDKLPDYNSGIKFTPEVKQKMSRLHSLYGSIVLRHYGRHPIEAIAAEDHHAIDTKRFADRSPEEKRYVIITAMIDQYDAMIVDNRSYRTRTFTLDDVRKEWNDKIVSHLTDDMKEFFAKAEKAFVSQVIPTYNDEDVDWGSLHGSTYRERGELEQAYNLLPLQPTPIADDETRDQIADWGITKPFVTDLQDLTSSLRYGESILKSIRIADNGGYIYDVPGGGEQIIIPDFFNFTDRLDGQCADLAYQFVTMLHRSGYLGELNKSLAEQGKPPIVPAIMGGFSRTHFTGEQAKFQYVGHFWPALLPEGESPKKAIVVDPSFQEISRMGHNGYESVLPPNVDPQSYTGKTALILNPTDAKVTSDGIKTQNGFNSATLGISNDGKLLYSLTFLRDRDKFYPLITAQTSDGSRNTPYCVGGIEGPEEGVLFVQDTILTQEQRNEMATIVANLAKMPLSRNQREARAARIREENVYFEAEAAKAQASGVKKKISQEN